MARKCSFKYGLTTAVATTAALTGGLASAATVDELFIGVGGTSVILSDENRQQLINRVGDANTIDVGDSLFGIIAFEQLFVTPPGGSPIPTDITHNAGNSEVTGTFQVRVAEKTAIGGGEFRFVFEADPDYDTFGLGTVVRLYEDDLGDAPDTTFQGNLDDMSSAGVFSDDDLLFAAGLANASNGYYGTGLDIIGGPGVNASTRIGNSVFALDLTEIGTFTLAGRLATLSNPAGSGAFIGVSDTGGPIPGSDWDLSGNADAQFLIVPSPTAFAGGLAMLGMTLVRRRNAE